jgi:hypothetical protein
MKEPGFEKEEMFQMLQSIAEKTKGNQTAHRFKQTFHIFIEMLCHLLFLVLLISAFCLPGYLETKLDAFEDEYIGFYTLDLDERKTWSTLLTITLFFCSLLPLAMGVLLHRLRSRNKTVNEVFIIANDGLSKLNN